MKPRFTPAPWEVRKGDPITENLVANVRGISVYGPYAASSCGDDARLISAAPDLLEAFRSFMQFAAFVEALRELDGEEPLNPHTCVMQAMGGGGSVGIYWSDFLEARAAIAKATGETPASSLPAPATGGQAE